MRTIDKLIIVLTIVSFLGTVVSWATTNEIALIITVVTLAISLAFFLIRFLMTRVHLQKHEEYKPFEQFLEDADKVDIIGINLAGIVSGHQSFIEDKATKGCKFRFVLTNPSFTSLLPMSQQTKRNIENTVDLLTRVMKKTNNVEIGLLPFPPAYSLLIKHVDAKWFSRYIFSARENNFSLGFSRFHLYELSEKTTKSQTVIQVEIYSQIELFNDVALAHKRPHFTITRNNNKYWYNHFCQEFEDTWKLATH